MMDQPRTARPATRPAHGFTLIELLTVIAIIGILAAILIPVVSRVRESARDSVCKTRLRTLNEAVLLFSLDHDEFIPQGFGTNHWYWWEDINHYLDIPDPHVSNAQHRCPSGWASQQFGDDVLPARWANMDYGMRWTGTPFDSDNTLGTTSRLVRVSQIENHSRYTMFLDALHASDPAPGSTAIFGPVRFTRMYNNVSDAGLLEELVFRHNGRMNVVALDGSVRSYTNRDVVEAGGPSAFWLEEMGENPGEQSGM